MILKGSKPFLALISLGATALLHGQSDVAQVPPMGWNSYDCFSYAVNESEVEANADFMSKNL